MVMVQPQRVSWFKYVQITMWISNPDLGGRLIQTGHLEPIGSWDEVTSKWPGAKATKLATLVKTKADGSSKVRFIADMRRSGVNGMVHLEEKIALPRGSDLVRDTLDLIEQGQAEVELYTADFADAFLNLPIDPAEMQYAIILAEPGQYCAYRGVPFGLASAPHCTKWHGVCSVLRLKSVNCMVFATF